MGKLVDKWTDRVTDMLFDPPRRINLDATISSSREANRHAYANARIPGLRELRIKIGEGVAKTENKGGRKT
jgi:hypothetical protein